MSDFLSSVDSRETSPEILEAISRLARDDAEAVAIWEAPTYEHALAIWELVTNNGLRDSTEYFWGSAGSRWAAELGLEG
jgi:hypothetical protein